MHIYVGADHGGFAAKKSLCLFLAEHGYQFTDCGPDQLVEGDDYPVYADAVSKQVTANPDSVGVLLCRSGQGMAIAANKHDGIRAIVAWDPKVAAEARNDNDANVISLPADILDDAGVSACVTAFAETPFSGEERHARRISELAELDKDS